MTKRDLQQYRSLCGEINAIKDEIERLQTFVQSPQLAGLHRGGGHPDRVGGLVRYRYIEGMPWESICIKMHYQWAQIHRIHAKAVQALQDDTQ